MKCLCCGRNLDPSNTSGWHKSCVKRFFGTDVLPEIRLSDEILEALASDTVKKGITVPGVQKKLSVHLFSEGDNPRLTLVGYPAGYIIKPQVKEFRAMPEAENLVMDMAASMKIRTAEHALIPYDGGYMYIVKRMDRIFLKNGEMEKLHMEDFCQLGGRLTADKYKSSYEQCVKIIKQYSSTPGADLTEFFMRTVFSFITGNSDMHLKNFSLLENSPGGEYSLSPAYDLLPVNIIMPEDEEETALTLNGKKRRLRRNDFIALARNMGMSIPHAEAMIDGMVKGRDRLIALVDDSVLPEDMKEDFRMLIRERTGRLGG